MTRRSILCSAAIAALTVWCGALRAEHGDKRLQEVQYDPRAVVTVPVKRGIVTLVELDRDEAITEVATGLGSDCGKPEAVWCVAAQAGGRTIFIKPKSAALAPNTLAVVTDRRSHSFRLIVLPDGDAREPVYRLVVKAPVIRTVAAVAATAPVATESFVEVQSVLELSPHDLVAERLKAAPVVVNSNYSISEGTAADDIVPTLVFDDGRFTYFRFPGNREVPAVFHVLGDGSETLVNTRMEDDLLVVDRVSRKLVLRAGSAVVGVWNEAFDLEGVPAKNGSTVNGVQRVVKAGARQ